MNKPSATATTQALVSVFVFACLLMWSENVSAVAPAPDYGWSVSSAYREGTVAMIDMGRDGEVSFVYYHSDHWDRVSANIFHRPGVRFVGAEPSEESAVVVGDVSSPAPVWWLLLLAGIMTHCARTVNAAKSNTLPHRS
jgi:hypothetical protein